MSKIVFYEFYDVMEKDFVSFVVYTTARKTFARIAELVDFVSDKLGICS